MRPRGRDVVSSSVGRRAIVDAPSRTSAERTVIPGALAVRCGDGGAPRVVRAGGAARDLCPDGRPRRIPRRRGERRRVGVGGVARGPPDPAGRRVRSRGRAVLRRRARGELRPRPRVLHQHLRPVWRSRTALLRHRLSVRAHVSGRAVRGAGLLRRRRSGVLRRAAGAAWVRPGPGLRCLALHRLRRARAGVLRARRGLSLRGRRGVRVRPLRRAAFGMRHARRALLRGRRVRPGRTLPRGTLRARSDLR